MSETITIEDSDTTDMALLLGGLGRLTAEAMFDHDEERLRLLESLQERAVKDNPELAREVILGEMDDRVAVLGEMPEEIQDKLDLSLEDGYVVDDRETTTIEVEEGDDGS